MKKIIGIALVLALAMGIAAFAETTDPVPAVTEEAAPAEEEAPAAEDEAATTAEVEKVEDTSADLQDALDAYRKARQDKAVSDLEEELSDYVAAGSLTQEQADLILNSVKERQAAKNGECPNCGYNLRGTTPRQGGMRGGRQHSGMNGQRPDAQSGATPRQGGMQQRGQQMPGNQPMNGQQMPKMPGMVPQR